MLLKLFDQVVDHKLTHTTQDRDSEKMKNKEWMS